MLYEFATGRDYGPAEQRIVFDYDRDTGSTLFYDGARRVDGRAILPAGLSRWQAEGALLAVYDRGDYSTSLATLRFADRARMWLSEENPGDDSLEEFFCPGHDWVLQGDDEARGRSRCSLCGKDGDG